MRAARRNVRLESFVDRKWPPSDGWVRASDRLIAYRACVLHRSGSSTLPHFAYVVLTRDLLLMVRWPGPKSVQLLLRLVDITGIQAVFEAELFYISPGWEHSHKLRINHRNPEAEAENGKVTEDQLPIDLYLLPEDTTFVHFLQSAWTYCLIRSTINATSVTSDSHHLPHDAKSNIRMLNPEGAYQYERLIRHIRQSSISDTWPHPIATWSDDNRSFRHRLWQDDVVWLWLCRRARLATTDLMAASHPGSAVSLTCFYEIIAVLEVADTDAAWPIVEPTVKSIVAMFKEVINQEVDERVTDAFSAILFSMMWLPPANSAIYQTPVATVLESICQFNNQAAFCTKMLRRSLDLMRLEKLSSYEMVVLFKNLYMLKRVLEQRRHHRLLTSIRRDFSDDF